MIKTIESTPENVDGFLITGTLNKADYDHINKAIEKRLEKEESARLFVEMVELEEITPSAMLKDFKTAIKHYDDIEKMAIAAKDSWIKLAVKASDLLTPGIDMKFFTLGEKDKALTWLK